MSPIHKVSTLEELEAELAASHQGDVWFFKHSLICGVSSAAWREFQRFVDEQEPGRRQRYCVIEIQRSRDVSRMLAEKLAVRHQSPQAILVRRGAAAWRASHWSITRHALAGAEGSSSVLEV